MRLTVPAAGAALVAAMTAGAPIVLHATAARAASVFVELNPDTVPAGEDITLRASCEDNLKAATVSAEPLGDVEVSPEFGFLTATARVPAGTGAGDYPVLLECPTGRKATATLHVVSNVSPKRGPATGGGGTAPERIAPLLIGGGLLAIGAGLALGVVSIRRRRLG
ncbi:hypothetical protein [Actinoplanes sp. NPDC051851]|uniref:hypothetical protein n=1 Tax=Actinoplanes sp. NPDC051851 TaxID=3154753 RepID=UPI00341B495C